MLVRGYRAVEDGEWGEARMIHRLSHLSAPRSHGVQCRFGLGTVSGSVRYNLGCVVQPLRTVLAMFR